MKTLILMLFIFAACAPQAGAKEPWVNFAHLQHLTETIAMGGDSVDIVHIYANYPSYAWMDAKESGPEGIACVDDAARAAVVLLRHYELTRDEGSLRRARRLLGFIMKMQAEDGGFYNFIFADHTINRTGTTSYKSFGWWASRAVWCLSTAYRLLKRDDAPFAELCRRRVERTFPYIDTLLARYGRSVMKGRYRVPQWLLYGSGADVTSELVLGLIEYARASNDARVTRYIERLSDGMTLMQNGGWTNYPYGLHRSWETQWHAWGNGQTQALASAAGMLGMTKRMASARLEADCFYSRLLMNGMMKEMDVAAPEKKKMYEQIAYGVRPMAVGLLRLFEASHDTLYLKMAGLSASWLFGNNALQMALYDTATGRCFDGIRDSATVNRNSGAESTIEALGVVLELGRHPAAAKYFTYVRTRSYRAGQREAALFRGPAGEQAALVLDPKARTLKLLEGREAEGFIGTK